MQLDEQNKLQLKVQKCVEDRDTKHVKFVNVTGGDKGGQHVQFKGYGMPRALLEQYQPHGNVGAHDPEALEEKPCKCGNVVAVCGACGCGYAQVNSEGWVPPSRGKGSGDAIREPPTPEMHQLYVARDVVFTRMILRDLVLVKAVVAHDNMRILSYVDKKPLLHWYMNTGELYNLTMVRELLFIVQGNLACLEELGKIKYKYGAASTKYNLLELADVLYAHEIRATCVAIGLHNYVRWEGRVGRGGRGRAGSQRGGEAARGDGPGRG
jgi:hypothetical protein